ncbi:MAG: hypothetical protein H6730_19625 [Deltaproteobacteria bacterium]|nr:hypothetical protein [Deltaproteobacteria bacterium]
MQAADEVAALTQATRLAELRGRQSVARRDLMDAALSTLCKGSAEVEGQAVQAILRSALCGRRVGQVPKEAGVPPIVRDFKARSEALKVSTGPVAREVALSLYQRAPHREASRFLHALRFLEVPYATWLAGPRYEAGEGLERRQETWRLRWTPDVERALVERSVYGPTVAEAAAARLEEAVAALGEAGHAQDAEAAVRLLVVAFVMGAFQVAQDLLPKVEAALATDARLERVVAALTVLVLSLEGREPLEVGAAAEAVRRQAHVAYHRACQLVQQVAVAPEARVEAVVTALQSLRQLAATEAAGLEVGKLAFAVGAALAGPRGSPKVEGALAGLAFGLGAEDAEALARRVRGHLLGTGRDTAGKVAFLFGVMATAREVAWRVPAVVEGLSSLFVEWPEAEFLAALPELRLAFGQLTPREVDRVARAVAVGAADPASAGPGPTASEARSRAEPGGGGWDGSAGPGPTASEARSRAEPGGGRVGRLRRPGTHGKRSAQPGGARRRRWDGSAGPGPTASGARNRAEPGGGGWDGATEARVRAALAADGLADWGAA